MSGVTMSCDSNVVPLENEIVIPADRHFHGMQSNLKTDIHIPFDIISLVQVHLHTREVKKPKYATYHLHASFVFFFWVGCVSHVKVYHIYSVSVIVSFLENKLKDK